MESSNCVTAKTIHLQYGKSSLSSEETSCCGSFWNVVLWPFKFVGGIFASIGKFFMEYVFCCCKCRGGGDTIDYEQTKNVLTTLLEGLNKIQEANAKTKDLNDAMTKLSPQALDEFKKQLGLVCAAADYADNNNQTTIKGSDLEDYYTKNKDNLKIDDYLANAQSNRLKTAVKNYLEIVTDKLEKSS